MHIKRGGRTKREIREEGETGKRGCTSDQQRIKPSKSLEKKIFIRVRVYYAKTHLQHDCHHACPCHKRAQNIVVFITLH